MLSALPRRDLTAHWALWIVARDMATDAPFPVGYWTGDQDATITAEGQARAYYGAGGLLGIEPVTFEAGAAIKVQRVSVGPLMPAVRQVLRGYDTRQAAAELHLVTLNPLGAVTSVQRAFRGVVDRFEINEGPIDDAGNSTVTCDMEMVSDARMLTRTLSLKQSDASQRLRSASDAFRQYADVAGEVKVTWMGETDNPHRAREIRRARTRLRNLRR